MTEQIWEEPEIYRVRIDIPKNPLKNLNIYVLKSQGQWLVIDTGFNRPSCRGALWKGLGELQLDFSRTSLFLTHFHGDHMGLAWDFAKRGIPIYMGEQEYLYYKNHSVEDLMREVNGVFVREGFPEQLLAGREAELAGEMPAPGFPVIPWRDGQELLLGEVRIQAVCTPGHTPGHTVLYLPHQQLLFSGDHILFDITPNISIWPEIEHSLADYLESLGRIRGMSIRRAFPAHRETGEDVYGRIDALLGHHQRRLKEILVTIRENPGLTAYDTAAAISWSARGLRWEEFPLRQRWFAMGETLAHLYHLEEEGRIARRDGNRLVGMS